MKERPTMKKYIERRFGSIAVENGMITKDQFVEAFSIQAKENIDNEQHRLIGQILVDLGYLTYAQVYEVLRILDRFVLKTLTDNNGEKFHPRSNALSESPAGS
jgi:hypothetical protein